MRVERVQTGPSTSFKADSSALRRFQSKIFMERLEVDFGTESKDDDLGVNEEKASVLLLFVDSGLSGLKGKKKVKKEGEVR